MFSSTSLLVGSLTLGVFACSNAWAETPVLVVTSDTTICFIGTDQKAKCRPLVKTNDDGIACLESGKPVLECLYQPEPCNTRAHPISCGG